MKRGDIFWDNDQWKIYIPSTDYAFTHAEDINTGTFCALFRTNTGINYRETRHSDDDILGNIFDILEKMPKQN